MQPADQYWLIAKICTGRPGLFTLAAIDSYGQQGWDQGLGVDFEAKASASNLLKSSSRPEALKTSQGEYKTEAKMSTSSTMYNHEKTL